MLLERGRVGGIVDGHDHLPAETPHFGSEGLAHRLPVGVGGSKHGEIAHTIAIRVARQGVRPLLGVRRADTVTACLVEGFEAWDDPHNHDPGYTRVRVRERVLPVLETELGPGVTEALARTAGQLREDTALLDGLAAEALARARRGPDSGPDFGLDVAVLGAEPPAIRHRVVHRAALDAGSPASELTRDHVLAVDALLTGWRGQKWIDLPGPLRALRRDGLLVFEAP